MTADTHHDGIPITPALPPTPPPASRLGRYAYRILETHNPQPGEHRYHIGYGYVYDGTFELVGVVPGTGRHTRSQIESLFLNRWYVRHESH